MVQNYRTFLFYPSDNALELTKELVNESSLPIQLIVPDGNWRQASKVHYRHPELFTVQRIKISTPNTSLYHLRAESTEYGMATLEAIAKALGIIEYEEVRNKLPLLYYKKTRTNI